MTEFFGDFKASGLIDIRAGCCSAPHWRGLAGKLLVAVVGVAVAQAVAGETVCPRDPAGRGSGVERAVVSSAATEQPENLYLHSFRLFAFPTGVSAQVFRTSNRTNA